MDFAWLVCIFEYMPYFIFFFHHFKKCPKKLSPSNTKVKLLVTSPPILLHSRKEWTVTCFVYRKELLIRGTILV